MLTTLRSAAIATAFSLTALALAAPAFAAADASQAVLAAPVARPVSLIIDGRQWTCADTKCFAPASDVAESQPIGRECMRAAAQLGAFASYQTGSKTLSAEKLAACNGAAPAKLETTIADKH